MKKDFNPYQEWLGIAGEGRPVHFYRLLDLPPREPNRDKIRAAVQRQSARVRQQQLGRHAEAAQAVLNEIATAWATLSDPPRKAVYDQTLREEPAVAVAAAKPLSRRERRRQDVSNQSAVGYGVALGAPLGLLLVVAIVQPFGHATPAESRLVLQWPESERTAATLSVDGWALPLPATGAVEIRMAPGEHQVVARRPQYSTYEERLTLLAGQRRELQPKWISASGRPASPAPADTSVADSGAKPPAPTESPDSASTASAPNSSPPTSASPPGAMAGGSQTSVPPAMDARVLSPDRLERVRKSLVQVSFGYGANQGGLVVDQGFVVTTIPAAPSVFQAIVQFGDGSVAQTGQSLGVDPARNLLLLQVAVPAAVPGLSLATTAPAEGDQVVAVGGPAPAFPGQPDVGQTIRCSLRQPPGLAGAAGGEQPFGLMGSGGSPRWIYCSDAVPLGAVLVDRMGRAAGLVVRQQAGRSVAVAAAEVPPPGMQVALSDLARLLVSSASPPPAALGPGAKPIPTMPSQPQNFNPPRNRAGRRNSPPTVAGGPYRIALPSELVLDSQQFDSGLSKAVQAVRTLLANSLYVFDQAVDAGSQRLLQARQAQSALALVLRNADSSVRAVVQSSGGKLDGPVVVLHPGQEVTRYATGDVTPSWYASFPENRAEGALQSWKVDGSKQYYCQYSHGRQQGLCCWFEQDQPRLALEYASDRLTAVHLISGTTVAKSFDSEEKAKADAEARPLLEKAFQHAEALKQEEAEVRRGVKDKDRELLDAIAAILSQQKRGNMLNRIDQRGEQRARNMKDIINKSRRR